MERVGGIEGVALGRMALCAGPALIEADVPLAACFCFVNPDSQGGAFRSSAP